MCITVTPARRVFCYGGVNFPDPNPRLSPEEVKAALAVQYPELATAAINGPQAVGDQLRYELVRAVGSKG